MGGDRGKSAHAPRAIRRGQGREERYPRKQKHHGRTERNRVLLRPQVADNGDLQQLTCAVIRPHAIKDTGDIIDRILSEGFEISAFQMQALSTVAAEEFLEVYKG